MRHDVTIEGSLYRLRPIADSDASFVVGLRNNPELNRFLHASSSKLEDQLAWQTKYYQRTGDYYFMIERSLDGVREGTIALYDIDTSMNTGEWGRWILKPGSLAAVESALLIYRAGFDVFRLDSVYCRTVAENARVVSFHDSCGISERRTLPGHFDLGRGCYDAIEHRVDHSNWNDVRSRLEHLVRLTMRRVGRA